MSRVAKALRKASAQAVTDDGWDQAERAGGDALEGQPGPRSDAAGRLPWKLQEIAPESGDLHVDQAQATHAGADGMRPHLTALVRRVFLSPPVGAGIRTVLFCSADGPSEPTHVATACARVLASQTQNRICLLDTRADGVLPGERGDRRDEEQVAGPLVGSPRRMSGNLWVAASAHMLDAMPAEVVSRQVRELCASFDHLIIDAPALHDGVEPWVLASQVQGVILVVNEERTRRDTARRAAAALEAAGARMLGVVLANQRYPIPQSIYARL